MANTLAPKATAELAHQLLSMTPENAATIVDLMTDDQKADVLVTIKAARETLTSPYFAAEHLIEDSIAKTLIARREERGGDAAIAIPHPHLDIKLEAQYGPYQIDVEQLEEALPALEIMERAKLVRVVPEHEVPAHVVPRQVLPGNTASILAVAKKYAGSSVGAIIAASIKRDRLGDKITIRPKAVK